jgi:hypothetical protein
LGSATSARSESEAMTKKKKQQQQKESRDDMANAAARVIIDAERQAHAAKTARLREVRLAKEETDLLAHAPRAPRAKVLKAKGAKR